MTKSTHWTFNPTGNYSDIDVSFASLVFTGEQVKSQHLGGYSRGGKMTDYFSTNSPGYTGISPTLATCVNSSCPDGFWSSWLVVIFRQRWRKQSSGGLAWAGHQILFTVLKETGGRARDTEDFRDPHLFNAAAGGAEHVDGVAGNQNHGGESHEPADHLTPQRIHVLPQSQRGHLNGTEGENSLWM